MPRKYTKKTTTITALLPERRIITDWQSIAVYLLLNVTVEADPSKAEAALRIILDPIATHLRTVLLNDIVDAQHKVIENLVKGDYDYDDLENEIVFSTQLRTLRDNLLKPQQ